MLNHITNNFLFQIWIFNFDISTVFSFLMGIMVGALIICGIYAIFVLASLQDKRIINKPTEDLSVDDVKKMIEDTKKAFKDPYLRQNSNRIAYCYTLSEGLVFGIATKFFPRSRHPLLEISIDEALELTLYVQKRLDEILNKKGIRLLKKMKVSSIVELTTKTSSILDSKVFKATKEVSSAISTVKKVINVVNPAWWFKKIVISNTINIITEKICLVIISIVGEETYKIYSKKVFDKTVEIDSDIDSILEDMGNDIQSANQEINPLYENNVVKNEVVFKKRYIKKDINVANVEYNKSIDLFNCKQDVSSDSFAKYNSKYLKENVNV